MHAPRYTQRRGMAVLSSDVENNILTMIEGISALLFESKPMAKAVMFKSVSYDQ